MLKSRWNTVLLLPLLFTQHSFAEDRPSLVGTWEVVTFEAVSPTTGEREPARGEHPSGYIIFTPEGRMSVLITNEGRKPPTKVDVAANPALNGTEQRRSFQLTGDRLQESTDAVPWAIHPEKGLVKFVISYRRAK
jgi:Lipocalin-like domain